MKFVSFVVGTFSSEREKKLETHRIETSTDASFPVLLGATQITERFDVDG